MIEYTISNYRLIVSEQPGVAPMTELNILPINAQGVKRAIAEYSRQASTTLSTLYEKYQRFNVEYWNGELPDATLAVAVEMHDKKLAHYAELNGYQIPNAIEFNRNFLALNWEGPVIEPPDRTIIDHVLLHEMIHLYLQAVKGETYKDQQAAHGRSFRREADRLGIKGKGRLMACSYPVKMPISAPKARKLKREQEEAHDQDDHTEAHQQQQTEPPAHTLPKLDTEQLLGELQQRATSQLDTHQLTQFEKHLKSIAAILQGEAPQRRQVKRLTFEDKLDRAIKRCLTNSAERRLYDGQMVMNQEIERRTEYYRVKAKDNPGSDDSIIATWLEIQLEQRNRQK